MKTFEINKDAVFVLRIAPMTIFNQFVFDMNNRLQHLDKDRRLKIVSRVVCDLENTDIFTPIHKMCNDYDDLLDSQEAIACENALSREDRIKELQVFYSGSLDDEDTIEKERITRTRCGRTDLHDAVSMNDLEMIRKLIVEDHADVNVKDNNGHTPIHIAILEENEAAISLFRELGHLPAA